MVKFNYSVTVLLSVYVPTSSVFFICLCWMTSDMLTRLTERVKQANNDSRVNFDVSINTWRHQNYRVFQLIDKINQFYGPYLLIIIGSSFVMTVNCSFNVMQSVSDGSKTRLLISNLFVLVTQFSFFVPLVYVPHRMRESVCCLLLNLQYMYKL